MKSLDSFDFAALPSLNKTLVLELARSEYVTRRENIIAVGNSGTGKTHIGLGLGLAACQKGLSVGFTTAAALVHELLEARDEKRLLRLQRQFPSVLPDLTDQHLKDLGIALGNRLKMLRAIRELSGAVLASPRPAFTEPKPQDTAERSGRQVGDQIAPPPPASRALPWFECYADQVGSLRSSCGMPG